MPPLTILDETFHLAPGDLLKEKQRPDGTWVLQNKHPGRVFFELEVVGQPSRWNTLRALRILQWYERQHSESRPENREE